MDTLIAMFFTLGLMGGTHEAPTEPPAVQEPPQYQQTAPEHRFETREIRRQRILATNSWLKELRQVHGSAGTSSQTITVALSSEAAGP